MTYNRLKNKRVLITQSEDYMGRDIKDLFEEEGAIVFADNRDLTPDIAAKNLVEEIGHIDILIANLAAVNPKTSIEDTSEEIWNNGFDIMVHPLHRLVRSCIPQMKERKSGKIIVMGSATALRGQKNRSSYSAARGAQVAYVKSVGIEVASFNIQINLIAQNFVENPSYYPPDYIKTEEFKNRMKEVPINRLATGREDAMLALFLASEESNFFVGQIFPFAGGWVV